MKDTDTLVQNYRNRSNALGSLGTDLTPVMEERKCEPAPNQSSDDEDDLNRAAILIQGKFRAKKLEKASKDGMDCYGWIPYGNDLN